MEFNLINTDEKSRARAGLLQTPHGEIQTPVFMPVGTLGTVKGIGQKYLKESIRASILLSNTYHLYLRPGMDIIGNAGGLHRFMNWDGPILTDSGGFQVFSLSELRKLSEKGVSFNSHIDGSRHFFTPESVIDIQRIIGSDIMMALDECTEYPVGLDHARKSLEITHHWLERGFEHFKNTESRYGYVQSLFPIVQGSTFKDLRKESAGKIASMNADGNAIGGLSVGEPAEIMYEMVDIVTNILPTGKPRYLMGVGTPVNLLEAIALGVDMFDCVLPTRNGRNGMIFTGNGMINIKNQKWQKDFSPVDETMPGTPGGEYSKAYLRHLFIAGEMLGKQIASIQNLNFYLRLMKEARINIINNNFAAWKNKIIPDISRRL